jgi:hypothetical protein
MLGPEVIPDRKGRAVNGFACKGGVHSFNFVHRSVSSFVSSYLNEEGISANPLLSAEHPHPSLVFHMPEPKILHLREWPYPLDS